MRRRSLLATVAATGAFAGCLGDNHSVESGADFTAESHVVGSDYVEDVNVRHEGYFPDSYQTLLENRSMADERLESTDEIDEFVNATDFDDAYLLVIVAGTWSGDTDVFVPEVERIEDGFRVEVESENGEQLDDTFRTIILRVTDETADRPERLVVVSDGEESDNTEID